MIRDKMKKVQDLQKTVGVLIWILCLLEGHPEGKFKGTIQDEKVEPKIHWTISDYKTGRSNVLPISVIAFTIRAS